MDPLKEFRSRVRSSDNRRIENRSNCSWKRLPSNEINKFQQDARLSQKRIKQITRAFIKDKGIHKNNVGVLTNVKGKMYCLKLGQVGNFKEFSHYFYASQYRRKFDTINENQELHDTPSNKNTLPQRDNHDLGQKIQKLAENQPYIHDVLGQSFNGQNISKSIREIFNNRSNPTKMPNKVEQNFIKDSEFLPKRINEQKAKNNLKKAYIRPLLVNTKSLNKNWNGKTHRNSEMLKGGIKQQEDAQKMHPQRKVL